MMRHFKFFTGLEFVFGAFLIYYVVEELLEVKSRKLGYFSSFHNCLDVCVIVVIPELNILIHYVGHNITDMRAAYVYDVFTDIHSNYWI